MTVYAKVGADGGPSSDGVVSDWIRRVDLWLEDFQVGRFSILVDNTSQQAEGDFNPHEAVEIKIDDVTMMKGWVDDAYVVGLPVGRVPELEIVGRDYARKLADLYYSTVAYGNGLSKIDDIIAAVNAAAATGVTYSSPSTAPTKPYVFNRTYLQDGFKDLCLFADYLYYVDTANTLQLFAASSAASTGVTLKSVAAAADNTILDFRRGESVGADIRNYIEAEAGDINDHLTEGNYDAWTGLTGCTVSDETTITLAGSASIKITRGTDGIYGATFPFTVATCGRTTIDMTAHDTGRYLVYQTISGGSSPRFRPRLTDGSGNVIEYYSFPGAAGDPGFTDELPQTTWDEIEFPLGDDCVIKSVLSNGYWWYITGSSFDWSDVVSIGFTTVASFTAGNSFYVDGLHLPYAALQVAEDATSQATYGKRMLPLMRSDIASQIELNRFVESTLAKYKDPLQTLHVVVIGDTDLRYTGQTVVVNAPNVSSVSYRIQSLHVMYGDAVQAEWGYPFVDALDLVRQTI